MRHMVSVCVFLVSWGTPRCPGVFSGLFILRQNLTHCILKLNITRIVLNNMMRLMKVNLQINKKDDKNEQTKVF